MAIGINAGAYDFQIRLDGAARILESSTPITDWIVSDAILPCPSRSAKNHLTIRNVGDSPRILTLYVNGQHVVEAVVEDPPYTRWWAAFAASNLTARPEIMAYFTNLFVREATGAELATWVDE